MGKTRTASNSQVAWALLTEGVVSSRLEVHRIQHLLSRAMKIVDASSEKDHIYQVAGDIIQAIPHRIEQLATVLDRTAYALSVMGEDHLRDRLPFADRMLVDNAVENAVILAPGSIERSAQRVSFRYIAQQTARRFADLMPPLGYPGEACRVIDRIQDEIRSPQLRERLVDDVAQGAALSNSDASKVYTPEIDKGVGRFNPIIISSHAQYRMDLRGITVPLLRRFFQDFLNAYGGYQGDWFVKFERGDTLEWIDRRLNNLNVVFTKHSSGGVRIITVMWKGEPDPSPPGDGGCEE